MLPEDEDKSQVHVPHKAPSQHSTLLVEAVDITSDGVEKSEQKSTFKF
jgi:hypothetical protein